MPKKSQSLAEFPYMLSKEGKSRNPSFDETFDGVANLLRGRKNVVVLVGAGISVSCGIPDFRSKEFGLYNTLDTGALGLSCAEDLFDLSFFMDEPGPFYAFAKNLYFPKGENIKVEPSDSHKLLALLEERKMLLRVYSQNIDGLEHTAGVSKKKIVYAHGSLHWATCTRCQQKCSADEIIPSIKKGLVATCKAERKFRRGSSSGSTGSSSANASPREPLHRSKKKQRTESNDFCGGVMKPGVTFFGETLNDSVRRSLEADREKIDALIVIGTSLSVAPISKVIEYMPPGIPRILINRTIVKPSVRNEESEEDEKELRENHVFDAYLLGFCDNVTRCLAKRLFHKDFSSTTNNHNGKQVGLLLTDVFEGDNQDYRAKEWHQVDVPPERVLLFAGAQPSHSDVTQDTSYCEIAHCDGCSKRIRGTIRKCVDCFDFDLCRKCFPVVSKQHFDGRHTFNAEQLDH